MTGEACAVFIFENGIPIKVMISEGRFFEINTPEDTERFIQQWHA